MKNFILSLCVVLAVSSAQVSRAQVITWFGGSCPEVTTQEDFDLHPYMGKWFELERFPNTFESGDCGVANYFLEADKTVTVNNTELREAGPNTVIGQGRADPSSSIASHLQVRFSRWQPWGKYWVLETDYDHYTVVYACSNYVIKKVEFLWILGRDRSLSYSTLNSIYDLLKGFKIDTTKLEKSAQTSEKCKAFD